MSTLKTIDRQHFEDLLGMSTGYVLYPHLTNASFRSLFVESTGKDIYSDQYAIHGDSKANRLRAFWQIESDQVVGKVLGELTDLWEYKNREANEREKAIAKRCRQIASRLLGDNITASVAELTEEQFLKHEFVVVSIAKVKIEANLIPILEARFQEACRCVKTGCSLSTIFMCGSVLEGLLLGVAFANTAKFTQASQAPKDRGGKIKSLPEWSLAQLIDVSCELNYLKLDVKKFSHALRDFRNYIHPYQQMRSQFDPDKHTAEICIQVLKAAVASLSGERN